MVATEYFFFPILPQCTSRSRFGAIFLEAEGDDPTAVEFVNVGRECLAILERYRRQGAVSFSLNFGDALRLTTLKFRMELLAQEMESG